MSADQAGAALYLAAKKGDAQRVRALFVAGADLHAKPVRVGCRAGKRLARAAQRVAMRAARGARGSSPPRRAARPLIPPRRTR